MNIEGNDACAKFFDEEMADKIIIVRKVAHVHDLCRTPDEKCAGR